MIGTGTFKVKKKLASIVAAVTMAIAIAGAQAATGGRFDLLSKLHGKNAATSTSTSTSTTTTTTTSTPTTTASITTTPTLSTSNSLYPELNTVPSNFDVTSALTTGNPIPAQNGEEVGALRFFCTAGQLLNDDPIVYPGQAGKSHLHQFYGNTAANASSTYESLRTSGTSTCTSNLNRSAYWMPAMLDGKGNAVRPDLINVYYKRLPIGDTRCHLGQPQAVGNCIPLPNGLRFVYGYNMTTHTVPAGAFSFDCLGTDANGGLIRFGGVYQTITEVAAVCPTTPNANGQYNQLRVVLAAPSCWDGKNLDSPDHRSHMANTNYDRGYPSCPDTHPFVIPSFTLQALYTVDANLGTWHLASDEMVPGTPAGSTMHADWFGAWDNVVESIWVDNCMNKKLSCNSGDLGNGTSMKNTAGSNVFSMASPRLVPVPPMTM